ncbi:MAG: segregation and condensation protein [Proteobacteria bacterium]|nr:segregation and condensation protein [Pseudomonadota bacterium]
MTDTHSELKNIIEAALLVAGQPLTLDKLLSLFPEDSRPGRDEVRAALKQLETDYEQRGIELRQIDQGFRFQSREKYAEWIARLSEERPVRYSRALLETLAIIAYRQPVTRGEIEDIRGVAVSSEIIKTLVVRQVGTRDVPGRPALYGTTRGFLEHFNLKGLDALPPLVELRDIDRIAAELNMSLPMDDTGPATEGENPEMDAAPRESTPADATAESAIALQAGADNAGSPAAKL